MSSSWAHTNSSSTLAARSRISDTATVLVPALLLVTAPECTRALCSPPASAAWQDARLMRPLRVGPGPQAFASSSGGAARLAAPLRVWPFGPPALLLVTAPEPTRAPCAPPAPAARQDARLMRPLRGVGPGPLSFPTCFPPPHGPPGPPHWRMPCSRGGDGWR